MNERTQDAIRDAQEHLNRARTVLLQAIEFAENANDNQEVIYRLKDEAGDMDGIDYRLGKLASGRN